MDRSPRALLARLGVTRAELPGLLVACAGAVVALLVALRLPLGAMGAEVGVAPPAPVLTPAPTPTAGPTLVLVHVTGAVGTPGVVELSAGARVADAVAASGGPSTDAALAAINLARPVVDGEQLHVPTADEVARGLVPSSAPSAGAGPAGRLPDGRIDLNTADAELLEELPGVGPVLAARIVAHREDVGGFDEPAALREVSGIGEATWAGLRDLVGVAGV